MTRLQTMSAALLMGGATCLMVSESASAQCIECAPTGHLGIAMKVIENKIHTGIYQYDAVNPATVDVGQRVWASDHFQENPLDPFFVDLPCFGATADSGAWPWGLSR